MSKLLIALLALDIGVSLSKVYIFTWKLKTQQKRTNYFFRRKEINIRHSFFLWVLIYKINN